MKICIIHGSPRKGNTYKAVQIVKEAMLKKGKVEFIEYFLPKDTPHFCRGCFACFEKGEEHCPHAQYVQPIAQSMREADGIILSSPVYVLAENGAVKALLDHYGYMFMVHRPMPEMFSKIGMVISTTAGAGTGYAMKTIARSFNFWGMKRIYKCGLTLSAKEWEEMKLEKQQKFKGKLHRKADQFYRAVENRKKLSPRIFTRLLFMVMRRMVFSFPNRLDQEYWKDKGWDNPRNTPF